MTAAPRETDLALPRRSRRNEAPDSTGDAGFLGWVWPSYRSRPVERWKDHVVTPQEDWLAEEVPVVLVYNGQSHVVMLATPLDLEDFALGFSLTEGIVGSSREILSIRVHHRSEGIEVRMRIAPERQAALAGRERNLTGRTGCGLCGTASLRQALRHPGRVQADIRISAEDMHQALSDLRGRQELNRLTGAVHAAAWAVPGPGVVSVREDIGRHNALDKLVGLLAKTGVGHDDGYVLVTSRASYEMVQKCAAAGIGLMVAISAPTGLAVRLAEETGVTLVGFARGNSHVVYAHPWRLA